MTDFLHALLSSDVPFIRYALITGLVSSVPFGIIGSFVVVKRMSYVAGAVSHSVLGGIGLALFCNNVLGLKQISPMTGAFTFAILMSVILSYAIIRGKERIDTVIGAIWAVGMSIGLLFMSVTPGYTDPMSYLFGNILLLTFRDILLITVLAAIITVISGIFYNQIVATIFDEDFARIRGLNVNIFMIMLIVLISVTILLLITIVGIVMVIAMLTIPPAIGGLFTKKLRGMMAISAGLCAVFMTAGLVLSFLLSLPTGSLTVVIAGVAYILSIIFYRVRNGMIRARLEIK